MWRPRKAQDDRGLGDARGRCALLRKPMQPAAFSGSPPRGDFARVDRGRRGAELSADRRFRIFADRRRRAYYLLAGLGTAERARHLLQGLFGPTGASLGLSCLRPQHWRHPDLGRKDFRLLGPASAAGTQEPRPRAVQSVRRRPRGGGPCCLGDPAGVNPAIKIIAAPWSAPPWMKTSTAATSPGHLEAGELFGLCQILREIHRDDAPARHPRQRTSGRAERAAEPEERAEHGDERRRTGSLHQGPPGTGDAPRRPTRRSSAGTTIATASIFRSRRAVDVEVARIHLRRYAWHLYNGTPDAMSSTIARPVPRQGRSTSPSNGCRRRKRS